MVIIDEASQADLTALAAVYMGRQVVVVGDHEQVSPVAIGQKLDEVRTEASSRPYIDEHLQGIPNAADYLKILRREILYLRASANYISTRLFAGAFPLCTLNHPIQQRSLLSREDQTIA